MVRCALDMTQRTNILIVIVVALLALVLWSVPHFLPEPETPVEAPSEAPPANDGAEPELPDAPAEAPERPDFTGAGTQPDLSDARRSTADGLYRDLKSAADSIGEARDQARLTDKPQYTLPELERAEDDETEPEPDPEP